MTLTVEEKQEVVQQFGKDGSDTGSPEVQIALLTRRINHSEAYSIDGACTHAAESSSPVSFAPKSVSTTTSLENSCR